MKCILKRLLFLFAIVGFSSASYSFAQIDKGTIAGTLKDAQGAVVPGANVTVTRTDTQQQRSLVTDKSGAYTAELLTAGTYSVADVEAQIEIGCQLLELPDDVVDEELGRVAPDAAITPVS